MVLKYKKSLSGVVAVALLLVTTIVAVVSFQSWYNNYASSIFGDVEGKNFASSTKIDSIVGGNLYFVNGNGENITITDIKIDGVSCNISGNYSDGLNEIPLNNCTSNAQSVTPEVLVVTSDGLYSKKIYLSNLVISSVSSGSCTNKCVGYPSTSCSPNPNIGTVTGYGAGSGVDRIYGRRYTPTTSGTIIGIDLYHIRSFASPDPDNVYACAYKNNTLIGSADLSSYTTLNSWTGLVNLTEEVADSLDYISGDVLTFGLCIDNVVTAPYLQLDNSEGGLHWYDSSSSFTTPPSSAVWAGPSASTGLKIIMKVCED